VGRGVITAQGDACLRHRLSFEGPQVIRFSYRFRFPSGVQRGDLGFTAGFNSDPQGFCVSFSNGGGLEVVDPSGYHKVDVVPTPQDPEALVKVELRYDGSSNLTVFVNGARGGQLDCGPRNSGDFFLHAFGTLMFELSELSIEARVTESSLALLRESWIDSTLREAGMR